LAQAIVCNNLAEAVGECRLVIGTSARERRLEWPLLLPYEAAGQLTREALQGDAALVFGRERFGLTNEELDACHFLVNIPANPDYSSLNLAAAVQVLCYELRRNCGQPKPPAEPVSEEDLPATAQEVEGFYGHLEETLCHIGIMTPEDPKQTLLRRLRRLFQRTRLTRTEVNILRGILTATQKLSRRS
jgi:TrmH family RNA methyltransferase